ncbi:unnamed protein product [Cylicocyclus nassatus]|uniref:Uncharacterized protein n=1 Tax=Cylicocyclus nassatus TaxID=53992 RepID=A0AA36HBP0_CYLNA|nr:unnamed protein product [Cylicocyclus nassatus]
MASAIVIGEGKLAAVLTKILCSHGTPVALFGATKSTKESIESMLQDHVEKSFPLQFVDDLKHQKDMLFRLMENLRMTDDVSRLFGEVIVDATHGNTPLVRAVRRFVPDAPVMSLDGTATDEKTIGVHVYQPFDVTRIMQVVTSPKTDPDSLARVRTLLKNANVVELNKEEGVMAEKALDEWRSEGSAALRLQKLMNSIVPSRMVIKSNYSVMH